jgi:hypothetical protein
LRGFGARTLTISSELAEALGFQNTAFSPGVHVSESTQKYSYYDTIPKTAFHQILLYKWKKQLTPVEEPAEPIIDDLIVNLSSAITDAGHKVSFLD